ncbi:hypothetical protein SOVF_145180 [Spinacia oleracea]|nr:hypothetical protein SOVF_145180 [Spinacia oleracea]
MDTSAGQGLYPLHHCKTIHLVRHAQGFHNVAGDKDVEAYLSYDYLDASLTSRGWEQGVHPCDKRRSKTEYETLFPAIDFSLIENDEDVLWKEDLRETDEELAKRGMKFLNWLWTRSEKEIAIVSHSGFLFHTLSAFGKDCHQVVKDEICTHFANCELRSMVFVDKCMASADSPMTNFPGKIPNGLDLPSDVAADKLA